MGQQEIIKLNDDEVFNFERMGIKDVLHDLQEVGKHIEFAHHFAKSLIHIVREAMAGGEQQITQEFGPNLLLLAYAIGQAGLVLESLVRVVKKDAGGNGSSSSPE